MARKPKLDALLAESQAQEVARDALLAVEPAERVGEHLDVVAEDSRVATHFFECHLDGYPGWRWYVTLTRAARAKISTVNESGLLPGDGALIAPDWVPWEERLRAYKEEEAARQAAEQEPTETESPVDDAATGAESTDADEGESATGDSADADDVEGPDTPGEGHAENGPENGPESGSIEPNSQERERQRRRRQRTRRRQRSRRSHRGNQKR